jgi:hypothetical protein
MNRRGGFVLAASFGVVACFTTFPARQLNAQSAGAAAAATQTPSNPKELVTQARHKYYTVTEHGFAGFSSDAKPDWDAMLTEAKVDPATTTAVMPILKSTQFKVLVGADGASTISPVAELPPPNEEVAARLRQTTQGFQQVVTGFLQTWSGFALNQMLPPTDGVEYHVVPDASGYKVSYAESGANVVLSLNHELTITNVEVASDTTNGSMQPTFSSIAGGLILSGYDAQFKMKDGSTSRITTKVQSIAVDGIELPGTVDAVVYEGEMQVPLHFTFSGYRLTKKQ